MSTSIGFPHGQFPGFNVGSGARAASRTRSMPPLGARHGTAEQRSGPRQTLIQRRRERSRDRSPSITIRADPIGSMESGQPSHNGFVTNFGNTSQRIPRAVRGQLCWFFPRWFQHEMAIGRCLDPQDRSTTSRLMPEKGWRVIIATCPASKTGKQKMATKGV